MFFLECHACAILHAAQAPGDVGSGHDWCLDATRQSWPLPTRPLARKSGPNIKVEDVSLKARLDSLLYLSMFGSFTLKTPCFELAARVLPAQPVNLLCLAWKGTKDLWLHEVAAEVTLRAWRAGSEHVCRSRIH